MASNILEVDRLSKRFCRDPKRSISYTIQDILNDVTLKDTHAQLRTGEFWALKDISFHVKQGEVLGIMGRNGAGKSTLLNTVMGIYRPTSGRINLNSRNVVVLGAQGDLQPVQSGRENIVNKLSLFGMSQREIAENIEAVIDFAELGDAIDFPVGTYSFGMRMRLSFAIFTRLRPALFVVDEGLNGGDMNFQRKFNNYLKDYISTGGSILLASHHLPLMQVCHKCMLIDRGELKAFGEPLDVVDAYHQMVDQQDREAGQFVSNDRSGRLPDCFKNQVTEPNAQTVSIHSLNVYSADAGELTTNSSAILEIICDATVDYPAVGCVIELGSKNINPLSVLADLRPLKSGRNIIRCTIKTLPLIPGTYFVSAYLSDSSTQTVLVSKGFTDPPTDFNIVEPPSHHNSFARFRGSPLSLAASWASSERSE